MTNTKVTNDNLIAKPSVTTSNVKDNAVLAEALFLSEQIGWSVIPVGSNKKPLINWKEFQTRKANKEEITQWFNDFPNAGVGVVTGKISGLIVFDIDPRHGGTDTPFESYDTVVVKTGGGGKHFYFKFPEDIQNTTNLIQGVDVRAEGGYVIAPPTLHDSGVKYEWINKPSETNLLKLPTALLDLFTKVEKHSNNEKYLGVSEGKRNDSAASLIGELLNKYKNEEWDSKVWPLVVAWNSTNKPPMPSDELKTTFDSICKTAGRSDQDKSKKTVADILIEMVLESGASLYLDQNKVPHITFPDRPIVGYSLSSSVFKQWIRGRYWDEYKKGFSSDTLNIALSTLEGKAFHEGEIKTLYNRIARLKSSIYYDMGDDKQVVVVNESGWYLSTESPVIFRRFTHQQVQVTPLPGGSIKSLLEYVNLGYKTDKLLFLTYAVAVLIPDIPRVVIVNIGDQGSAKSTALRLVRSLVDPSSVELMTPPSELLELAQAANHNYCLYLDNLSSLSTKISDALCGLVTGVGFSKRKLFTDDEDVLFDQKVAIGISGINLVAEKADLLDRCLILQYQRIPNEQRKSEHEFWIQFNEQKPYILGALFTALSTTLKVVKNIKLTNKPRMADYARYGASAAIALGNTSEDFIIAFDENVTRQNKAALESSSTAQVVLAFMREHPAWQGTSSDLYNALKAIAEKSGLQIGGSDGFPKSSNWLWRRIMQVRPNLLALGIQALKEETAESSIIKLTNLKKVKDTSNAATVATDAMEAMATESSKKDTATEDLLKLLRPNDVLNDKPEDFDTSNYFKGTTP